MHNPDTGANSAGSMLLTVEEAADWMRLSPSYLNKMRVTGDGPPFFKPGRRVLYRRGDLDRWLDARRFNSTSQAEAA